MSASQIVTHPSMELVARALGYRTTPHNRIEDAEVEAGIDANRSVQDQRQAASEEMNRTK
jgi:hypothetical protein